MSIKFEKKEMFSQKNHHSNISFRFSLNALSNLRKPLALNCNKYYSKHFNGLIIANLQNDNGKKFS